MLNKLVIAAAIATASTVAVAAQPGSKDDVIFFDSPKTLIPVRAATAPATATVSAPVSAPVPASFFKNPEPPVCIPQGEIITAAWDIRSKASMSAMAKRLISDKPKHVVFYTNSKDKKLAKAVEIVLGGSNYTVQKSKDNGPLRVEFFDLFPAKKPVCERVYLHDTASAITYEGDAEKLMRKIAAAARLKLEVEGKGKFDLSLSIANTPYADLMAQIEAEFAGRASLMFNARKDAIVMRFPPAAQPASPAQTTGDLVRTKPQQVVTDAERAAAATYWEKHGTAAALVGTGGQVEYAYGQSRPTITCAPLHLCSIQLIEGEAISSISLGDTTRWMVKDTSAGERPVLIVKPTQAGLRTNLVVTTTEGRTYYMHLVSEETNYVPMVAFYDPQQMVQDMRQHVQNIAAQKQSTEATERINAINASLEALEETDKRERKHDHAVVADVGPGVDPAGLDFNFTCQGEETFRPSRVFASTTHTYIQLPREVAAADAPAVFNTTSGETELMNARFDRGYYIVDGRPASLKLALGVGDKARVVECKHKSAQKKSAFSFPFFGE